MISQAFPRKRQLGTLQVSEFTVPVLTQPVKQTAFQSMHSAKLFGESPLRISRRNDRSPRLELAALGARFALGSFFFWW
jgi:hypothetical protein